MRPHHYLIVAFALCVISCTKSSDSPSMREQRIELLVNKKWQLTSDFYYQQSDNGGSIKNEEVGWVKHTLDNFVIYYPDFTMEWNDNQVLDPYHSTTVYSGTWQISEDGQTITTQLLSPEVLSAYSQQFISVGENEYKTTDVRNAYGTPITYYSTYIVIP